MEEPGVKTVVETDVAPAQEVLPRATLVRRHRAARIVI